MAAELSYAWPHPGEGFGETLAADRPGVRLHPAKAAVGLAVEGPAKLDSRIELAEWDTEVVGKLQGHRAQWFVPMRVSVRIEVGWLPPDERAKFAQLLH